MTIHGTPDHRVLATGRVRVRATAPDEAEALRRLSALEAEVGPLPWAFVLEPAEPELPFEVRAELPGATRAPETPGFRLEPAESPGLQEALDRAWLVEERAEFGPVVVRRWLAGEEPRRPDLHRPDATDEVLQRVEAALAAAAAPFPLLSDDPQRGGHGVVPVVHRATGVAGLEAWIGGDPLPERQSVLARVAEVVEREPALLPWVDFDEAFGQLLVRCWLAARPGPGLPADDDADLSVDAGWWADRVAHAADVEVQVIPVTPGDHDAVVERAAAVAADAGLAGGPPRWLSGGRFAASWVGELPPVEVLATLRALPGVAAIRVVPGVPYGLETEWPVIEPSIRVVGGVTWHRLRDPVVDRDRREEVSDREPDERDHLAAAVVAADVRPVLDAAGRRGLEVRGGPETLTALGLDALLADAAAMQASALARLGTWSFERRGAVARRWWRDGVDPGPRRWEVAR